MSKSKLYLSWIPELVPGPSASRSSTCTYPLVVSLMRLAHVLNPRARVTAWPPQHTLTSSASQVFDTTLQTGIYSSYHTRSSLCPRKAINRNAEFSPAPFWRQLQDDAHDKRPTSEKEHGIQRQGHRNIRLIAVLVLFIRSRERLPLLFLLLLLLSLALCPLLRCLAFMLGLALLLVVLICCGLGLLL
jgi:hypothetical protein